LLTILALLLLLRSAEALKLCRAVDLVDHCLHPEYMELLSNRTISLLANNPVAVFEPPTGYELQINTTDLQYCETGTIYCWGNVIYSFVSICNTTNSTITLANLEWSCSNTFNPATLDPNSPSSQTYLPVHELNEQTHIPDLGVVMFVSPVARTGGASVATFDADCNNAAQDIFAGTYKALLPSNDTVSVLTSFYPFLNVSVVRPDGLVITYDETSLIVENSNDAFNPLVNFPNLFANGTVYTGYVRTGLSVNPVSMDEGGLLTADNHRCPNRLFTGRTCGSYACGLHECPTTVGTIGNPSDVLAYQFSGKFSGYEFCDVALPVYCLRDDVPFVCPA